MAILKHSHTGEACLLRANHIFGRDAKHCDTLLDTPYASRIHAHIRWHGTEWVLQECSRNGTRVSGSLLRVGERIKLHVGDLIQFGHEREAWRIDDLHDPVDTLWPISGQAKPIALADHQALPSSSATPAYLLRAPDESWQLYTVDGKRPLADGDEIACGDLAWRLVLAPRSDTMQLALPLESLHALQRIDFMVSQDEEHVRAWLHTAMQTLDLGERAHHYCLATLARARFAAQQSGHSAATQGWIELAQLARMLGQPAMHINVQIHRARMQLAALQRPEAEQLLERRRGAVRFGALPFRVFRGDTLECQWLPADHPAPYAHGSAIQETRPR
ncbi:FHA domain-containing protein [Paludibacterium purpuratum]|uniref:FHA domain protein n=1 Tax=Paludibacterium purpuratum TaxID=1144873 RepID=A0A4R7B258_9NEIS|nr:FHA domain-containing protein [Paludibacterium purpuratum]TDR77809.1 FHA domain protein [Paludibacterium purpuratum]